MSVTLASVAATYAQMQKTAVAPGMEARAGGPDFGSLVRDAADTSIKALQKGEAASVLGLAGKADLGAVVTAVSNAEVTLQAAVAVRDKVVQSYNDILRMPI